jgi:hypothetical protein
LREIAVFGGTAHPALAAEMSAGSLVDLQVLTLAWPRPGETEHRFQDYPPVLAALIVGG